MARANSNSNGKAHMDKATESENTPLLPKNDEARLNSPTSGRYWQRYGHVNEGKDIKDYQTIFDDESLEDGYIVMSDDDDPADENKQVVANPQLHENLGDNNKIEKETSEIGVKQASSNA